VVWNLSSAPFTLVSNGPVIPLSSRYQLHETFVEAKKVQKKHLICLVLPSFYQFNGHTAMEDKGKAKPYFTYFGGLLSAERILFLMSPGGTQRNPIR
jgi:hypothetical protein